MSSLSANNIQAAPAALVSSATREGQPHSCVLCSRRKVKCDRRDPCSNCTKARVDCIYRAPATPRRRRRRSPERSLHARLRRYEQMLENYGVKTEELEGEPASHISDSVDQRKSSVAGSDSPNTIQGGSSAEGMEPAAMHQDKLVVGESRKRPFLTPFT
ncbi:MAG: hypothetical protein Q9214_003393 [Letrouitia sp. 1 TL-2023]